jgi:putative membrane-bound dehydrogenase-like protein
MLLMLLRGSLESAEPSDAPGDRQGDFRRLLTHVPPTPPDQSLGSFRLEPGLKIELVAAEPLISDPVDVAWDEDGRLYVCELWNYPGAPKPGEPLGRVRLLESTAGDGTYDKSTIFADQVIWPGGAICWDGGVFVVSSPDLWYMKDTDGDGKADVREKVFTGFRGQTYQVANSLRWGPDNRIYVSGSYAGGTVSKVGRDGKPIGEGIRARAFRFDPRTREIEAVSGGGEWGQSFDDWGERYACDATHLVWHPVLPREEVDRNPYLVVGSVQEMSIPEWTRVYPISRPEPWKAARQQFWSRWKDGNADMRAGRFPETELAPHGFATSAAGITVYRGSALGDAYRNDAFIGEPANNVVIRLKLTEEGVGVRAARPPEDERQRREFLASTDNWFRPVNFANGPDGCLYVIAMYREIIEDESAIPGDILQHYDLDSGRERGRIYRIAAEGFVRPRLPRMSGLDSRQLVELLDHRDVWGRETAQRLLYQRQDKTCVGALRELAGGAAKTPQGKIQALWTLRGLSGVTADALLTALRDPDAHVRQHAVKLAQDQVVDSPKLVDAVLAAATDPAKRVRFQAAFTLGRSDDDRALAALAAIARADPADPWMRTAILTAVPRRAGRLFDLLAGVRDFVDRPGAVSLLSGLAGAAGTRNDGGEVPQLLATLCGKALDGRDAAQREILRQLADGLAQAGVSLAAHWPASGQATAGALREFFERAARTALDSTAEPRERIEAVGLVGHAPWSLGERPLGELLRPGQPQAVQIAAVRALAPRAEPAVASIVVSAWPGLSPGVRPVAIEALLRRPERLGALLDAIEKRTILPRDLEPKRREAMLRSPDAALRARAARLLAAPPAVDKRSLIERYEGAVSKLSGDPRRGEPVFVKSCAVCHRPEQGQAVGPNLATLEDRTLPTLLVSILDPNRDVKPNFVSYSVETTAGDELSGIITNETATGITLRQAAGVEEVVLRGNIKSMRSTGASMMPEGFEAIIDERQMADLIAFLQALRK